MADFVFTSPGVKFKERDLTFVTRNVGITTLGLVGETLKGPAFEPVFIQDKTQFSTRFGGQSPVKISNGSTLIPKYELPYVANSYLEESNQLWVTRVLGLSGYDAGKAWAITLNAGIDPSTIVVGASSGYTEIFTDGVYLGNMIEITGQTGTTFYGFHKYTATAFSGYSYTFVITAFNPNTGNGTASTVRTLLTGTEYTKYKNMVLAVVRSRGTVKDNVNLPPTTTFDTTTLTITGNTTNLNTGNLFGQFTLHAFSTGSTINYMATLNPNDSSYLPNVIGSDAKDKTAKIWVEEVYPDLIEKLDSDGDTAPTGLTIYGISGIMPYAYGVNTILIQCNTNNFTDYKTLFQTPLTPWVVSQLKGSTIDRLFRFISISDGNAANQEIKISIANINPITLEFDVVVRDFYDTDANPNVLETFSRCTLIEGQTTFIAQRIGTTDGQYDLLSQYIMVELADNINPDDFPAGFEGYNFKNFALSATTSGSIPTNYAGKAPAIFYKTKYNDDERVRRVYLGISEHGYDTATGLGTGINQNFFNFNGKSGFVNSKGFHMDSGATGTYHGFQYEVGDGSFRTVNDIAYATNPYFDIASRKFTLVPAGGFDGWNVNRSSRSYRDGFQMNGIYDGVAPNVVPTNDFQAWETAIQTYSNPEEVTINVFATPGIDWSNNTIMVQDTIEMIEQQRADTLYVIDCPLVGNPQQVGQAKQDVPFATDVVDLLTTTDIDSSYSCTYFPWIQVRDTQNNVNLYIPPTGEVVKAMAFTDNTAFPWFAPAGLNRGVTDARKSMFKLSEEARGILYQGRINPMADFAEAGTAIFGQKTLQVKASALDRINVRRLLLQIKVLIANIAIRLVFEQGDQTTIDQFLSKATPILDTIKRERGLNDFRIKMDDSNNTPESLGRNELYGELFLKPTRAVEYIGITFTITPSGASFADVGA